MLSGCRDFIWKSQGIGAWNATASSVPDMAKLAKDLGVFEFVTFCGALPRAEVLTKFAQCDVLLHPALHESSGWASIEAMAAGRKSVV